MSDIPKPETPEMLAYGAEVLEWAIERARQNSIDTWAEALLKCERIDIRASRENHSYSIMPEFLQSLADSLRSQAEADLVVAPELIDGVRESLDGLSVRK